MAAKKGTKKSSSKSKVEVDFTDVEERKGAKRYKPGDYGVKVAKAEYGKSKNKGTKQISFELKFVDGKYKGSTIYHNCTLLPQSLWVLRNTLEALGIKVPKKSISLDLTKTIGKKMGVTIEDDEYEGKVKSRIVDTFPFSDLEDRGTDEELDDDDEDEDDEDDDEDLEEVDLDDEDEEDEDEDEDDD